MKLEFVRRTLEKFSSDKCHENLASGRRALPWRRKERQTERPDEANSHSSQVANDPNI
jgi:hypothetical protein